MRKQWKSSTSISYAFLAAGLFSVHLHVSLVSLITYLFFHYIGVLAQATCAQDQAAPDKNDSVSDKDEETST
jgi:hypothetical protein